MARVTCAISAALICAKSFFCSTSLSDTESRSSCSCACGVSLTCGSDSASWTRGEPTEPGSTRVRPYHWPSRQGPTWMARTGNPYHRSWLWIPGSRFARPEMTGAVVPSELILARRFLQDLLQRVALHPRDVVLVFQQRAECIADHLRGQRAGVEFGQRGGPVDGFGDARRFIEILLAQRLHEADHLLRQFRGNARHP